MSSKKRKVVFTIIIILVITVIPLSLLLISSFGCESKLYIADASFGMIYKFNDIILNTYGDSLTYSNKSGKRVTINYKLPARDQKDIYTLFTDVDILTYPDKVEGTLMVMSFGKPNPTELIVTLNQTRHTILGPENIEYQYNYWNSDGRDYNGLNEHEVTFLKLYEIVMKSIENKLK